MLDLRVILGLHFHNLGPGRSCTEAKHLVQTKIEQTAPETNSISRFTPLVPGDGLFFVRITKEALPVCLSGCRLSWEKRTAFPHKSLSRVPLCSTTHSAARAVPSTPQVSEWPHSLTLEKWSFGWRPTQLFHVNLTEVTAPSASLEAFQTGHLPKKRQWWS